MREGDDRMKRLVAILLPAVALSGCNSCPPKFSPGEIVRSEFLDREFLVMKQSPATNLEGYCLVDVRGKDGKIYTLSVDELSSVDP